MSEQSLARVREGYEFIDREHELDFDLLDPDVRWYQTKAEALKVVGLDG